MAQGDSVKLSSIDDSDVVDGKAPEEWDNSDIVDTVLNRKSETSDGDQRLFDGMQNVSTQSKDAILIRSRFTSDNFRQYFSEELDEQERRIWWEDDTLDSKLVKDGVSY
jgi:hypothetical protein